MALDGYEFLPAQYQLLLIRRFYPERTGRESAVIREWLNRYLHDYERIMFSVRVGVGQTPDPSHLIGVQRASVQSTRKRVDILAWRGGRVTLVEVKERVTHHALGQILAYQHLLLEEDPALDFEALVAIGRYSDVDTVRVLNAAGVTVLLYPVPEAST